MNGFSITSETTDGRLRFALRGELDLANAGRVEEALASQGDWDAISLVIIDMRELEFVDSSGLRALFLLDTAAREHGLRTVFVRGSEAVQRIFEVTALDERLEIVDDAEGLPSNALGS